MSTFPHSARPTGVAELVLALEALDRVVEELQRSLAELALPLDAASRDAARAAIAAARSRTPAR